jgi:hypothetical protein
MRIVASDEVARASAELLCAFQKAFPHAHLIPCEAIAGEAIHREVRLPSTHQADLTASQDKTLDLTHSIADRYGLDAASPARMSLHPGFDAVDPDG